MSKDRSENHMTTTPRTWKPEELPQIFRDCCTNFRTRYKMEIPFQMGEHIYAIDGAICVRMKGTLDAPPIESPPPCPSVYEPIGTLRTCHVPSVFRCKGEYSSACSRCGGSGKCLCSDCDAEHDCGRCGGGGTFKQFDYWRLCTADDSPVISSAYLSKIVAFACGRAFDIEWAASNKPLVIVFPSDGELPEVEFRVMPCSTQSIERTKGSVIGPISSCPSA